MSDWREDIANAPRGVNLELWSPEWIEVGGGCIDTEGRAYFPCCGDDMEPQPTHWKLPSEPPE